MTPKSKEELREQIRSISYKLAVNAYNHPQEYLVSDAKEFEDDIVRLFTSYHQHLYTRQDVKAICEEVVGEIDGRIENGRTVRGYLARNMLRYAQRQSIDSIIDKWGKA